jgi:hypothetical protein
MKQVPSYLEGMTATSRLLAAVRAEGNTTSAGLEYEATETISRNVAVQITEDDPERLALIVLLLHVHGDTIRELLTDPPWQREAVREPTPPGEKPKPSPMRNSLHHIKSSFADCSVAIEIDELDRLYMPLEFLVMNDLPRYRALDLQWQPRIMRLYL